MGSWRISDLTELAGAPNSFTWCPRAYAFNARGTSHIVYIAEDESLHELWSDSHGWHDTNLATAAGTPIGYPLGVPAGYAFEAQQTRHVVYNSTDWNIHELWWDDHGWHHGILTTAGLPSGQVSSAYAFNAQYTQHVIYTGYLDHHIHELWWDMHGWHHNDLTAATGAPTQDAAPFGYAFESRYSQHVVYPGTDKHVHELWWDPSGWHHADLTRVTSAPPVYLRSVEAYAFDAQRTRHVVYVGGTTEHQDVHIRELWADDDGWHHTDLSAATSAPSIGVPSGYAVNSRNTRHVLFAGHDHTPNHVHELTWDSRGWHYRDLTTATDAPAAQDPHGFAADTDATRHVIFRGLHDHHIYELQPDDRRDRARNLIDQFGLLWAQTRPSG